MAVRTVGQPMAVSEVKALGNELLSRIGHTPLLRLPHINREVPHVTLLAKAEWFNPGGSVKDRAAASIVADAERRGLLQGNRRLLDATSGNTGIAYAMIGAAKGYPVTLCVPKNASPATMTIIRSYGAEVIRTSPLEASDGAIREAQRLIREYPDRFVYLDQYNNDANWQAHYEGTGVEIWQQTRGTVTHFIAGVGTSGTLMGAGRRLKAYHADVTVIALQPDSPLNGLEGLKHMPSSIVPGIFDEQFPDAQWDIATEEAYAAVHRLAKAEGLLVGPSSGAALAGMLRLAHQVTSGVIVTVFPDHGFKYLHESFWEQAEER